MVPTGFRFISVAWARLMKPQFYGNANPPREMSIHWFPMNCPVSSNKCPHINHHSLSVDISSVYITSVIQVIVTNTYLHNCRVCLRWDYTSAAKHFLAICPYVTPWNLCVCGCMKWRTPVDFHLNNCVLLYLKNVPNHQIWSPLYYGYVMDKHGLVITCPAKFGMKLLIHSQTSTTQPLKFENGYVI